MQAIYLLKPDELDDGFLQLIKQQFKDKRIKISITDENSSSALALPNRQAGALKGKISISPDFDEPLADFEAYER